MKKTFETTAWDRWRELSYSHQREHVEAVLGAKKPETRARRIQAAVQSVASRPKKGAKSSKSLTASRKNRTSATGYALLLRGVNVGSKNSLPMAELRAMLTKLGCTDVQTYVQSGNAVFTTLLGTEELTQAIEGELERYMGRPIATTLRTEEQLRAIIDANPLAEVATSPTYSCVTFLSYPPTKAEVAPLHARDWGPERFVIAGAEIYTWHPSGQGQSALAAAIAKLRLRGAVTTRNWNTVLKLCEMLGGG